MRLVESLKEITKNAQAFSKIKKTDKSRALDSFGRFFHWYYFPDHEIFAPSKFIGYKNTSLSNYKFEERSGSETQQVLKKWFIGIERETKQFYELKEKLEKFADKIGKKISNKTFSGTGGIHVLSDDDDEADYPNEIPGDGIFEGAKKQVTVNAYERNRLARDKCIAHYGTNCFVCGFDFKKFYGNTLGKGFIHVHHLVDIAHIGKQYKVDPIKDLRPVCPNCHAMLHKESPAMSPDKLKDFIQRRTRRRFPTV